MMLADIVEYTTKEGGDWRKWPYPAHVKPSGLD
ncbi:hypothetical protein LCGC14_2169370, partial [marine sediment metagenome]